MTTPTSPKPEHVEKAREIVEAIRCKHCDGCGYVGGGYDPETGDSDPGRPCICTSNGQHEPHPISEIVDCQKLIDSIALALSDAEKASGIESLPKTKDGKVILPGMSMHFSSSIETTVLAVWFDGTIDLQSHHNGIPTNDWKRLRAEHFGYSTREAALSSLPAARKGQA